MSDEIEVSVLNRKCGLIWFDSASMRAAISSFSCSCSRCSIRALFQILIGMAIAEHRGEDDAAAVMPRRSSACEVEEPVRAEAVAERHAGCTSMHDRREHAGRPASRSAACGPIRQTRRCRSVKTNGEKCQMSCFGHSSRRPPPAKPQPTAKGSAAELAGEQRRQRRTSRPTSAPAYGPGDEAGQERRLRASGRRPCSRAAAAPRRRRQSGCRGQGEDRRSGQARRSVSRIARNRW